MNRTSIQHRTIATIATVLCLVFALPVLVCAQAEYDVQLSKLVLPDIAQYHGSKILRFAKPVAGAITVPPQWNDVEMATIVDDPRLEPAIAVRFQDGQGAVKYAVVSDGGRVFDSSSVLQFHPVRSRTIAYFPVHVRATNGANSDERQITYQLVVSNTRVIVRLAEIRQGTLKLGDRSYGIRIYAPSINNPFFDLSSNAACVIDMNNDGYYSWKWRVNDANGSLIPSERIDLSGPFAVEGHKLRALSIDPKGIEFRCSDYQGDTAAIVGLAAPEFTVTDLSGASHTLADNRGRIVLVTFWSTECPFCEQVRPELDSLVVHSDSTQLQAICAVAQSDQSEIAQFLRYQPYGGVIVPYDPLLWRTYNPRGSTPTYCIIDRDGSVIYSGAGASAFAVVKQIIEAKLSSMHKG